MKTFYDKNNDSNYHLHYYQEHKSRLDFCVEAFGLKDIKDSLVADFGCGHGFLFSMMDQSNRFRGFDGADVHCAKKIIPFQYVQCDLNQAIPSSAMEKADVSFCFETLEHLESPYRCLVEIKRLTKQDAPIYISIPDQCMTHNTPYPGIFYPEGNFETFLAQMALPIQKKVLFQSGWPSWVYKCRNADWIEAKMMFPKSEEKFRGKTPVEYSNL